MKILILAIGKTSDRNISGAIDSYIWRASRYMECEMRFLPDIKNGSGNHEEQKLREGSTILGSVTASDRVVLLDERGKMMGSRAFAEFVKRFAVAGSKRVVFVIGGAFGFSKEVYSRADAMVSLSAMTFPHDLVRLIFAEQLYRAMTILRGEKYHHD